jgi:predicted RNA polymerase sigma factor
VRGVRAGLDSVKEIQNRKSIDTYYLLHAVHAEFQNELGNFKEAAAHLKKALNLTTIESERAFLGSKLRKCEEKLAV